MDSSQLQVISDEGEDEEGGMGFDEQYERMIKRQLGGLLQDYIVFTESSKEEDKQRALKDKPYRNMIETLREFQSVPEIQTFPVRSVAEMESYRAQSRQDYLRCIDHTNVVLDLDFAPLFTDASD